MATEYMDHPKTLRRSMSSPGYHMDGNPLPQQSYFVRPQALTVDQETNLHSPHHNYYQTYVYMDQLNQNQSHQQQHHQEQHQEHQQNHFGYSENVHRHFSTGGAFHSSPGSFSASEGKPLNGGSFEYTITPDMLMLRDNGADANSEEDSNGIAPKMNRSRTMSYYETLPPSPEPVTPMQAKNARQKYHVDTESGMVTPMSTRVQQQQHDHPGDAPYATTFKQGSGSPFKNPFLTPLSPPPTQQQHMHEEDLNSPVPAIHLDFKDSYKENRQQQQQQQQQQMQQQMQKQQRSQSAGVNPFYNPPSYIASHSPIRKSPLQRSLSPHSTAINTISAADAAQEAAQAALEVQTFSPLSVDSTYSTPMTSVGSTSTNTSDEAGPIGKNISSSTSNHYEIDDDTNNIPRTNRGTSPSKGIRKTVPRTEKIKLEECKESDLTPSGGLKRHYCEICNKRFRRLEHLKRHAKIHTHERPFLCDIPSCARRFSRSDNLRAHKRTHMKRGGRNEFVEGLEVE